MAIKQYVLLDWLNAEVPVYQSTADGNRVQLSKIPLHRPTLRQEFTDKDGKSKVIRYKSTSKTIYQDEQQTNEKIEANTPFTTTERNDLYFRFGIVTTNKEMAQKYLEAHPEFEGFEGDCETVPRPKYKLLDVEKDIKDKNSDTKQRVMAAASVYKLELEDAQTLLIKLNGSFFTVPTTLEECQNLLVDFIDDANEAGLKDVLAGVKTENIDLEKQILIGKLLNAELLSFDAVGGKISKKKDGNWIELRDMSDEYPQDEKLRLFANFLNTPEGKPLVDDLEKDLKKYKKEKEAVTTKT